MESLLSAYIFEVLPQNMQYHRVELSPAPDVVRAPSAPPRFSDRHPPPAPPTPEFLVIGLFALRLAKRLIESLDYYPGRNSDIIWLVNFLGPFSDGYSLAKISGSRKDDYLAMYQQIVSRMKRQPLYPIRFMQMNPDRSIHQTCRRSDAERPRDMTDIERIDIINFCDAAGEWGSNVPIPEREAARMLELADQRRIADLVQEQARRRRPEVQQDTRRAQIDPEPLLYEGRQPFREQETRPAQIDPEPLVHEYSPPLREVQHSRDDRHTPYTTQRPWRGDEYLPVEEEEEKEERTSTTAGRNRRVSFADEQRYFDV